FELELRQAIEGHRFRTFLAPIGGRFGPQQSIPQMAQRVRFSNYDDYANYLTRLEQVPAYVDNTIELMRLGLQEQRTLPQVTLLGIPDQFKALVEGNGLRMLADPLARMPESIPPQQQEALRERFENQAY